jgi:hypothetical protein
MQLKKCYRKGCQIFAAHMDEAPKDKVPKLEDHAILKYFEDLFKEIPVLGMCYIICMSRPCWIPDNPGQSNYWESKWPYQMFLFVGYVLYSLHE